ncbi:uncharacterized protein LOC123563372 isoform X2 [Mercenaria mercenaria]|uniref:uncharacterized protein LOC123563372 isoform X2 n=1 Tax=Mercenaria mercenaria TaxID=6596 RepID=UPI00234FAAB5|nr:uncharacterized protein LOC123563372 isoform X2 [Mercenaria mercenaria]
MAHEKQLRNPKYRSWVKSGLGLKYLKEGLEQFTVDVLDEQHLAILMTVRKASKSMATSCNQCQVNSLLPNHARTRSNHCPLGVNDCNCRQPKGKRTCPNDICGAIYEEVIHLHGSTPPAPYWRNTDATLWCSNPWEIGKCFINAPGYAHTRSASETDCAGLLHIIVNNKGFHSHLQCDINGSDILCKTRQYRNEILHSASMELENETAGNYIDDMIAVLQDAKELCSRAESVEAVKKLTELKTKDFIVSTENEMEIFQEMRKALAKETDESLEKIESTTTGRVSTIQEKFRDVDDAIQRTKAQTLDEIQASHHDLLNKHTLSLDVKATECLENIESSVRIQENRIIQSMKTAESDLTISKVEAIKEMKNIQSDLLNKHMEELGKKVEEINQTLSQKQLSIVKSLEQTGTKQKQMLKSMSKDVNSSEQKEIVVSTPQYITQRMYVDEADGSTEQKQPDYEMMKEVFKKRLISLYMETVVKVSALPLHLERNDATINDLYVTPWLKLDNNSCNVFKTKTSPEVAPGNERTLNVLEEMGWLPVFLLLYTSTNCHALYECNTCKCCKNGVSRCRRNDLCLDGCIDGYYGDSCQHACKPNCLQCVNPDSCTKCGDGYFGDYCVNCTDRCLTCTSWDTCSTCKDGYYIGRPNDNTAYTYPSDCRYNCPENCISCTSYNTCTKCKDGYYNGKWYTNSYMQYNDCRYKCKPNCKVCSSYDICDVCVEGKYNIENYKGCSYNCPLACESCTSYYNCTKCVAGKYGTYCQNWCGKGCKDNLCDINTGSCTCASNFQGDKCENCRQGKYGIYCNGFCPQGCEGQNCTRDGNCYRCISGFAGSQCDQCVAGMYGSNCDIPCPKGCSNNKCTRDGNCFRCNSGFAGSKCDQCIAGMYGSNCDIPCPKSCLNSTCTRDGNCFGCNSGCAGSHCDHCIAGMYGSNCDIPCPKGCSNNTCTRDGDCYRCISGLAGRQCDQCIAGMYGSNCDIPCPKNCSNNICTRDGDCYRCNSGFAGSKCDQCIAGMYGINCDTPCPKTCSNNTCTRNGHCYRCNSGFNGSKCDQCFAGMYGSNCDIPCPNTCSNTTCTRDGNCIQGCQNGYFGDKCLNRCSNYCINVTCSKDSGSCEFGCAGGFEGDDCTKSYIDVTVDTEESSKTSNIGAFVGVGVMAVAVTLLAVGIFVLIKRFTKQRKHTQEQPEMIYVQNASERRTYDQLSPPDFEMTANVTVSVYEQLHERNQDTTDYAEIERNNAKVQDRIQDLNNDSEMRRNYEQLQDRLQDSNTYSEMDRNYEQLQDRFQDSNTYSEMDRNYEQLQDRHRDSNNYSEIDRN